MSAAPKIGFTYVYNPVWGTPYLRQNTVTRKSQRVKAANDALSASSRANATIGKRGKILTSNSKKADYYKSRGIPVELVDLATIKKSLKDRLNKIKTDLKGKFHVPKGEPIAVKEVIEVMGR